MNARWIALTSLTILAAFAGCSRHVVRANAYNDFAIAAARRGLWQEAALRWEEALRTQPNDARFLNNIGVAREASERFDEALEAYRKALAADPKNEDYARNLRRAERNAERAANVKGDVSIEESEPPPDETDVLP